MASIIGSGWWARVNSLTASIKVVPGQGSFGLDSMGAPSELTVTSSGLRSTAPRRCLGGTESGLMPGVLPWPVILRWRFPFPDAKKLHAVLRTLV